MSFTNKFTKGNKKLTAKLNAGISAANKNTQTKNRQIDYPVHAIPSNGIHKAYCKNNASTGATITCYLDTDSTGTQITVYCKLYEAATNLNACAPLLVDGDLMFVYNDGTYWRSLTTFIKTGTC